MCRTPRQRALVTEERVQSGDGGVDASRIALIGSLLYAAKHWLDCSVPMGQGRLVGGMTDSVVGPGRLSIDFRTLSRAYSGPQLNGGRGSSASAPVGTLISIVTSSVLIYMHRGGTALSFPLLRALPLRSLPRPSSRPDLHSTGLLCHHRSDGVR